MKRKYGGCGESVANQKKTNKCLTLVVSIILTIDGNRCQCKITKLNIQYNKKKNIFLSN